MSEQDIVEYLEKLDKSDFYTSLVGAINKYLNKTLHIEYADTLLTFVLTNQFGQRITFAELSD